MGFSENISAARQGRFDRELRKIAATLENAHAANSSSASRAGRSLRGRPVVFVGSGGAHTAALFAARVHEFATRRLAKAQTPLEFLMSAPLPGVGAVLVSAEGRNPDIRAVGISPRFGAASVRVVLTAANSPLDRESRRNRTQLVSFASGRRDGFLATNSLIASCVTLAKMYGQSIRPEVGRLHPNPGIDALTRPVHFLLAAGWGWPAAADVESKLSESGLAACQLVDLRNVAHGRHAFVSRWSDACSATIMSDPDTRGLANQLERRLKDKIPVVHMQTELEGPTGALDLMIGGMRLVARFGHTREIDPGRPGVEAFGRRMYWDGMRGLRQ